MRSDWQRSERHGVSLAARCHPAGPDGGRTSLDDRFVAVVLRQPAKVPSFRDASIIASDPAQWAVAVQVLIRSVVLDGLDVDDPAVRGLGEVLRPLAEVELADAASAEANSNSRPAGAGTT